MTAGADVTAVPNEITGIIPVRPDLPDSALIVAASWEERCLGLLRKLRNYRSQIAILVIYDGESRLRTKHLQEMRELIRKIAPVQTVYARHDDPLPSVREVIDLTRPVSDAYSGITLDASTFTRKHLLQLLQGLDFAGLLQRCNIYYTEPTDYHTYDDEPIAQGISSVRAIESFGGVNLPSRDSLLILFLGYEGRRAFALWEHLEPNVTFAVIADPPYHPEWLGRAEAQNRYLMSRIPTENVFRTNGLSPHDTERLLEQLTYRRQNSNPLNVRVAPLGTKPQLLGTYRFWRRHRGSVTLVYASPVRYREELATFPPGRTWLIDRTESWVTSP